MTVYSYDKEDSVWVGADPGGRGAFGIAILGSGGQYETYCANNTDDAIRFVVDTLQVVPSGIGVDAPLWWSSGRSGDRLADQWIRKTFRLSGGQVQASNSLRGAALIQGAMFVHRMRDRFPTLQVTETHPKALLTALGQNSFDEFCRQYSICGPINGIGEHERDAIISAVAAREGFQGRWKRDLSLSRHPCELDPASHWIGPLHYFWPD